MKRMAILAALLLSILPVLSGCDSAIDLDERSFVFVVTLDAVDDGKLRVGIQIASGTQSLNESSAGSMSGTDEGSSGSGGGASQGGAGHSPTSPSHLQQGAYYLISTVGQDYWQALMLLHATIPRKLDFSHVREVLFSERLARSEAFTGLLLALMTTQSMRESAYVAVVQGDALDFAAHQQSFLGSRLSEYIDSRMRNAEYYGFVADATLAETWQNLRANRQDTLVSFAAVNDFSTPRALTAGRPLDDLPGHLPRTSINQTEYMGAAMIGRDGMVGTLTGYGMELTHLLRGGYQTLFYKSENTAAKIVKKRAPRLRVERRGERFRMEIDVYLLAWYGLFPQSSALDKLEAELREECLRQVQFFQAQRFDPLGFGRAAVRFFPTQEAWEAFDWREAFAQAEVIIRVHVEESDPV